ncbi:hypothetical protein T484DRAFT_1887655 [Baffinella frigidus]|nr:hypothetical protein T484DRAFT_1887655 [Cryptophyta sp. CCMP2293]
MPPRSPPRLHRFARSEIGSTGNECSSRGRQSLGRCAALLLMSAIAACPQTTSPHALPRAILDSRFSKPAGCGGPWGGGAPRREGSARLSLRGGRGGKSGSAGAPAAPDEAGDSDIEGLISRGELLEGAASQPEPASEDSEGGGYSDGGSAKGGSASQEDSGGRFPGPLGSEGDSEGEEEGEGGGEEEGEEGEEEDREGEEEEEDEMIDVDEEPRKKKKRKGKGANTMSLFREISGQMLALYDFPTVDAKKDPVQGWQSDRHIIFGLPNTTIFSPDRMSDRHIVFGLPNTTIFSPDRMVEFDEEAAFDVKLVEDKFYFKGFKDKFYNKSLNCSKQSTRIELMEGHRSAQVRMETGDAITDFVIDAIANDEIMDFKAIMTNITLTNWTAPPGWSRIPEDFTEHRAGLEAARYRPKDWAYLTWWIISTGL